MKVYLKPRVVKQLTKIPSSFRKLIENKIVFLGENPFPSGSNKLSAREGFRIRVGDYRILYTVNLKEKELIILSVAHRKEAYRH